MTQLSKSPLVILRRVYLDITGNHCAAKLIEYFKHWTKWKKSKHRTEWIYMPVRQIYDDLMGEHSVNIIRRAIAQLIEVGILNHRHNPGNGQDRTWQYCVNEEVLHSLLSDKAKVKSITPNVISDQCLTQDPPKISDPQQPDVVAFFQAVNQEVAAPCPISPTPPIKQEKAPTTATNHPQVFSDERIKEVEGMGIRLVNASLRTEIINATASVYKNAIAYVLEKMAAGKVKNPAGYLRTALTEGYDHKPPLSRREQEFDDAYKQLQAAGIVKIVEKRHLNIRSGETLVCVIDSSERGYYDLPWREALKLL